MKARLYAQPGGQGFITEVTLPPFKQWPDVLIWGERIFIMDGQASYREAFSYFVPLMFDYGELEKRTIEQFGDKPLHLKVSFVMAAIPKRGVQWTAEMMFAELQRMKLLPEGCTVQQVQKAMDHP